MRDESMMVALEQMVPL